MTGEELAHMREARIENCIREQLADLRGLGVDMTQPAWKRMEDYLKAVGNPYLFRVGDIAVKVSFDPSGKTLADALACVILAS